MRSSILLSTALAFVLIASTAVQPALSREKQDAAQQINDKIRPSLAAASDALNKKDYPTVIKQLEVAEPLAVTPYEKFIVGQMRAVAGLNTKDYALAGAGADLAVDSGYSDPKLSAFAFLSGQTAYNTQNYSKAVQRFTQAQQFGSLEPDLLVLTAQSDFKLNRTADGLAALSKLIAANDAAHKATPENVYGTAVTAAYNAKLTNEAIDWTVRRVKAYPSTVNWHDLAAIYLGMHTNIATQDELDIFRLMRATKSLKNAREVNEYGEILLDKKGLPGEAKSLYEESAAAGLLTPESVSTKELMALAKTKSVTDQASLPSYARQAETSANVKLVTGTAEDLFGYKDYPRAIALYKRALTLGGDNNSINLRLGEAYALLGDKVNAAAAFDAVTGTSAQIAHFWKIWLG